MSNDAPPSGRRLLLGSLTALGVVYGDIGTSPLYAMHECFGGGTAARIVENDVVGVLSLILWSLLIVVTVKYLAYVMHADNEGEGGILALMALAIDKKQPLARQRIVAWLGLFGAALLYGDGILTPAISVLSAVEGLEVAAPELGRWIVPITVAILLALFAIQHRGTARIGMLFGPITLVWFLVLGVAGASHISDEPRVLAALSPMHAIDFFARHGLAGATVLGAVFLVVTGGEALYADMGHFGARPIRLAWVVVVLPALVLNYFGQGALLLSNPETVHNPLFHMVPPWALLPMVFLGAAATVIASQAMISGAFSLTRQAMMLGFSPRLTMDHTSSAEIGQVYLPSVNWALAVGTLLLVLGFRSASALASAYGIAVSATMVITTLLAFVVSRRKWNLGLGVALLITLPLLAIDTAFLGANLLKVADGGWIPLAVGAAVFTMFTTWRTGRAYLSERIVERSLPWSKLDEWLATIKPVTVPGSAVYLAAHPSVVPLSLVSNVVHNHSLHERVLLLSIAFESTPRVSIRNRVTVERLGERFLRVTGHYGFMEDPDVPRLLELLVGEGIEIDPANTVFVLGRETLLAISGPGMWVVREHLFAFMSRNAQRPAAFFGIPSKRVLEIGTQIEL